MNHELKELLADDQRERQNHPQVGTPEYVTLRARDNERRQRVAELAAKGALQCAEDYFHVAFIFQHGETPDEAWQAHQYACRAAELGHADARWLAAASYDRWLMYQGKPQKYGTQFLPHFASQTYRLWRLDPTTGDEERAAWQVPSLAEQHARAEEMTRHSPLPPAEFAPVWFKELDWGDSL